MIWHLMAFVPSSVQLRSPPREATGNRDVPAQAALTSGVLCLSSPISTMKGTGTIWQRGRTDAAFAMRVLWKAVYLPGLVLPLQRSAPTPSPCADRRPLIVVFCWLFPFSS